jgi:predicted DNA-binding transcriptional regulator YafY
MGYRLGKGFDLPPLMFTHDEARALFASVRMAHAWQDPALAQASLLALGKILSVLPPAIRATAQSMAVFAQPTGLAHKEQLTLRTLREAMQEYRKVRLDYRDARDHSTQRVVRPLGCFFWGSVWTLATCCESRQDFRSFRLDRICTIERVEGQAGVFKDEAGKTLADYLRRVTPPDVQERLSHDS